MSARQLRPRVLRGKLAGVAQTVQDIRGPFDEGYEKAPLLVTEHFDALQKALDAFDRDLAKLDGRPGIP